MNLFNFKGIYGGNSIVTVKTTTDSTSQSINQLTRLNLSDNLLKIREQLTRKSIIDETLSFVNSEFAEIAFEEEEDFYLYKIIDKSGSNLILYLKSCPRISWKFLNNKHKLDYGCTLLTLDGIERASVRAFEMKNCELTEIGSEGYSTGDMKFKSSKDMMMKTNLFFNGDDIKIVELSIEDKKTNNTGYHFIKYGKASLKFDKYLEPTQEFINAVENAVNLQNPGEITQIIKKFGRCIPTEVILGGRAHFNDGYLTENSDESAMDIDTDINVDYLKERTNHCNSKYAKLDKLFGGELPISSGDFDETVWAKSLKDYKNWGCIEFRNPISIFQLLPKDLRNQVLKLVGKIIHHSNIETFNYYTLNNVRLKFFDLSIPPNILKIIMNKDADCNIFATVIDMTTSDNDFFTCQILYPQNGKPRLIIHCVQKEFRKREYNLKIGWIIVGYYTDFHFTLSDFDTQFDVQKIEVQKNDNDCSSLNSINTTVLNFDCNYDTPFCFGIPVLTRSDPSNKSLVIGHHFINKEGNGMGVRLFSYCLENNHYVNLPNFTFHILIVSNYRIHNNCCVVSINNTPMNVNEYPKFISLYSTQKIPIFLRHNSRQIETQSINCKNENCPICKNGTLLNQSDIEYASFDPFNSHAEKKVKQWIEQITVEQKIFKLIPWSEFDTASMKNIGAGGFGSVSKAYCLSTHSYIAYKKLNLQGVEAWEKFKHELLMQIRAHSCENIIRVLGISKNLSDEYVIVMEYADEGDLKTYLLKRFKELDWNRKFRLALDITNGLHYLHSENILHRDLHAGNVVIVQHGKAKITDFGHSKSMNTETNLHGCIFGNPRYVAPEIIEACNKEIHDPYTKSSDIYSLGVLLWQISSGKTPFEGRDKNMLSIAAMSGTREKRIADTPDEYHNLYDKCWDNKPEKRPIIKDVYDCLEKLLKEEDEKVNFDLVNKKKMLIKDMEEGKETNIDSVNKKKLLNEDDGEGEQMDISSEFDHHIIDWKEQYCSKFPVN